MKKKALATKAPEPTAPLGAETTVDLVALKALTAGLRDEAERVRKLTVDDDAEEQQAAAKLAQHKRTDKALKELIAKHKRPFLDVTQALDRMSKQGRDDLAAVIAAYTAILGAYNARKLEARREALAEAQAALQQRDTEGATEALNVRANNAQQKLDGVAIKMRWKATVINPEEVPRAWCCPDQSALDDHAAECDESTEPTPIPGVHFELVAGSRLK